MNKFQKRRLALLNRKLSDIIKPARKMSTLEWAEENLYVPATKAMGGKVSLWNTPVIAKMTELMDDPNYEQVWIMGGARSGKSFSTLAYVGKEITTTRRQILDAWPNDNMIRRFVKNDFADMLKASPIFRDIVPDENSDKKAGNYKNKIFKNGAKLIEANLQSSNDMSGVDAAIVCAHEIDRSPKSTGSDGSATGQLLARQQAQFFKKAFFESTPTYEGSQIHTGFEAGTQHEAHFKFTCCGEYNPIRFEHKLENGARAGVTWRTDDKGSILYDTVGYTCPTCGTIHDDNQLKAIIYQRGENELKLIPKYPDRIICSVHAGWLLLTPFGNMKTLVQDYEIALKSGHDMLATFYNLKLGLPYTIPGSKLDHDKLMARAVDAKKLVVPYGCVMLTAGVDVQKNYLAVQIIAWADDERRHVIYYDHIEGDTSTAEPWNKLFILLDNEFDTAYTTSTNKVTMPIEAVVCDTGGIDTHFYYTILRGRQPKYIAIKGSSSFTCPLIRKAKSIDIDYQGKLIEKGISLREIGVSQAKVYLYKQLDSSLNPTDRGHTTFGRFLPPSYFKELCSEQLVVVSDSTGNKNVYRFDQLYKRNEALDTFIYAYVGYVMTAGHSEEFLDYEKRLNILTSGSKLDGEKEIIEPAVVKEVNADRIMCKVLKKAYITSEGRYVNNGEFIDLSFSDYLVYAEHNIVSPYDSHDKVQKIKVFSEQQKAIDQRFSLENVVQYDDSTNNSFLIK